MTSFLHAMSLPFAASPFAAVLLAYQQSDSMGKGIVLIQVGMSVVTWCILFSKGRRLSETLARARKYREFFNGSDHTLALYRSARPSEENPLEIIYRAACDRLAKLFGPAGLDAWLRGVEGVSGLGESELELVRSATENSLSEQENELGFGMGFLASAVAAAPLLGLFGTVYGVMMAFQAMGRSGSALLSDVAPGISSAMLTTVVGLVVAIPTAVGYNVLQAKIQSISIQMEGFADDLAGRIGCDFKHR